MKNRVLLAIIVLLIIFSKKGMAQECADWVIKDVIVTYKEKGPLDKFEKPRKKDYLNKHIYQCDSLILFSTQLKAEFMYADTLVVGARRTVRRVEDDYLTATYPGNELSCSTVANDSCYVGTSFLNLLRYKGDKFTFYNVKSTGIDALPYKLCIIKDGETIGLLSDTDFMLLILQKVRRKR